MCWKLSSLLGSGSAETNLLIILFNLSWSGLHALKVDSHYKESLVISCAQKRHLQIITRCNPIRSGSLDGLVMRHRAFYLKVDAPNPDLPVVLRSDLRQVLCLQWAGALRVVHKYKFTEEKLPWRWFSLWLSPSLLSGYETEFLLFSWIVLTEGD